MKIEYVGLTHISGPLVVIDGVRGAAYDELCELTLSNGERRQGRVTALEGERAIIQVFEGTQGISLAETRTVFAARPVTLDLSPELPGRSFDGAGRPIDGLGAVYPTEQRDVGGAPINPVSRRYPRSCITTGISAIDAMMTLIRGQKLPIFSASGLKHNELAAQIVRQSKIGDGSNFLIVFAAMGVSADTADFFKRSFEESGALGRVVMFRNLASDPIIERILCPRCALTAAEYLAYKLGYHVLVVMTDMTAYCEALRELSSSKGEIPGRKGYPSYLYSDLASLYERAGMLNDSAGSVTQVPILTLPGDDITHPIPDLTGYITEGQIVLDRDLAGRGVYPPIAVLPSLSRLMKDGIGEGYTREDHPSVTNQLFAAYSKTQEARSLASVIGEDELSDTDKAYMEFGRRFEAELVGQPADQSRSIPETLDIGWQLLSLLPTSELDRLDEKLIAKHLGSEA